MSAELVLEAQDKTRAIFDQYGRSVVDLSDKTERFNLSLGRTSSSVRRLALPIVSELIPAMDTTAARMASVVTGAAYLATGLTAVGIAVGGVAAILIGQYVQAWREAAKAQREFQEVMDSWDAPRITGQLSLLRKELEELNKERAKLIERREGGIGGVVGLLPGADIGRTRRELDEINKQLADADRRIGIARFRLEAAQGFAMMEDPRAAPIPQGLGAAQAEQEARERAVRLGEEWSKGFAQGAQLLEDPRIAPWGAERWGVIADEEALKLGERWAAQFAEGARMLEDPRGAPRRAEDLRAMWAPDPEEMRQQQEILGIERERLDKLRELGPIVTEGQGEAIRSAEIELDRRRQLVGVTDEHTIALVNLRTEYERQIEIHEQLRRTDPAVGMLAGAQQLAEEWTSLGRVMEDVTLRTGHTMASALSDVLRGQGKDVGRRFADEMLRTITDMISRYAVGSLFARLGLPFAPSPAGPGALPGGLSVYSSTETIASLAARGAVFAQSPGRSAAFPWYGLPGTGDLSAVTQPWYSGPGDLSAVISGRGPVDPSTFASAYWPTTQGRAVLFPGSWPDGPLGGLPSPDLVHYGAASPELTQTGYLGFGRGGFNYLGAGLSAAGFALALYGAYQGGRGSANYAMGIGTGAVSGALTGAMLGSIIPGIGTAIGAVAGGLLGGLGGGFGANAGAARQARLHRRQQRGRDAARIADEISNALNGPLDVGEALRTRLSSGNSAGGLLLSLALRVGHTAMAMFLEGRGIAAEGFHYERLDTVDELIAYLGGGGAVRQYLDATLGALQGRQQLDESMLFAYTEREPQAGISRTTYSPLTALDQVAAGTQDLYTSTASWRRAGASDELIEHSLRRLMGRGIRRDMVLDLDEPSFLGIDT